MGEMDQFLDDSGPASLEYLDKVDLCKQKLEEKATKAEEAIAKEEQLKKEIQEKNAKILAEKNELAAKLESERGALGDVQEKITKLNSQKADLESQLTVS